jgi:hypothetical protein
MIYGVVSGPVAGYTIIGEEIHPSNSYSIYSMFNSRQINKCGAYD